MKRPTLLGLGLIGVLMLTLGIVQAVTARHTEPQCDLDTAIAHQAEHAQELADFADALKTDPDAALAALYRTGIAYQALAVECGFADGGGVEEEHVTEHSGASGTDGDAHSHSSSDTQAHSDAEESEMLAQARTIGDPEQGKIIFNTIQPEVSFACATCHRADSTETLVGPGLLGVSNHSHDHVDAASMDGANGMGGMHMGEGTAMPDSMSGMHMGEGTPMPDSMGGMHMGEVATDTHAASEVTLEQKVEFLRTSITDPGAFVMPGFPDNLMPKVYSTIFTEEEINNLIAYLLTLN
ncbi:MAG: c-type cytochrome [Anaerolineae bacterium]